MKSSTVTFIPIVKMKPVMKNEAAEILKRNQLSITHSRQKILELFRKHDGALAHADIEKKTREEFDRVTIYRTLQTFVEKGIVHVIPSADNSVLYALCKSHCTQESHNDNHVHFICDNCDTTYCLESVVIPPIKLPEGFKLSATNMLVSGICKKCG